MDRVKQYTVFEILEQLGRLINKAQKIRNDIPIDMKRGDARHVCLSGIQTSITPLMLSYGAIECANQSIKNIELSRICGLKQGTNEEISLHFDTWAKLTLLVFVHFRIESFFSNLLLAMDSSYNDKQSFKQKTADLFDKLGLAEVEEKQACLTAMSTMRNSLHNNSINKNDDFDKIIKGTKFKFIKGKHTSGTIFEQILLIDYSLEIIEEIIKSPKILALSAPIPDLFHIQMAGF